MSMSFEHNPSTNEKRTPLDLVGKTDVRRCKTRLQFHTHMSTADTYLLDLIARADISFSVNRWRLSSRTEVEAEIPIGLPNKSMYSSRSLDMDAGRRVI